ncbi:pancreatic secretory granule membrane major glycoprotein GP2-like isoform X2 [Ambystoma mexicanum]|uniref:pancreatic secretory granule membrane major glycoprotein GP2-like isoform X2 n=1 Tax=Ambystoma mexicanum TaxID=8296 RepID=UPI0037E74952
MKILLLLGVIWWSWQTAATSCPSCASDEVCNPDTLTCNCDLTKYKTSGGFTLELNCLPDAMQVVLSRCQLEKDLYNSSSPHYLDPKCKGVSAIVGNKSVILVNTASTNYTCGNLVLSNETHMTVSNTLQISTYTDGFSQTMSIACTYKSGGSSTNQTIFTPKLITTISNRRDGFGHFSARMALYWDANLSDPVQASQLLYVEDNVFIAVEVPDLDEGQFSVLVKSLFATPFADPSSTPRYSLVTEGCPSNVGANLFVKQNGHTKLASFKMRIFQIVGYESYTLFAELYLCDSSCSPKC